MRKSVFCGLLAFYSFVSLFANNTVPDSIQAQYNLAWSYLNQRDTLGQYAKAVQYMTHAANAGYSNAVSDLGYLYEYGKGCPRNLEKAFALYSKAADMYCNYVGANNACYCYLHGRGTKVNYQKAFHYVSQSAALGNMRGLYWKAYMYYWGYGCKQSYDSAVSIFAHLAVVDNYSWGMYFLGLCYINGYGIERNTEVGRYWLKRAAKIDVGFADSELDLNLPENHFSTEFVLSKGVQTEELKFKQVKHQAKQRLNGLYEGRLIQYDCSGNWLIAQSKLKLEVKTSGNTLTGSWTENDTLTTPLEAVFTDTSVMFTQGAYKKYDHYNIRKPIKWNFITAPISQKKIKGVISIEGNIAMRDSVENLTGKPNYFILTRIEDKEALNNNLKASANSIKASDIAFGDNHSLAVRLKKHKWINPPFDPSINSFSVRFDTVYTASERKESDFRQCFCEAYLDSLNKITAQQALPKFLEEYDFDRKHLPEVGILRPYSLRAYLVRLTYTNVLERIAQNANPKYFLHDSVMIKDAKYIVPERYQSTFDLVKEELQRRTKYEVWRDDVCQLHPSLCYSPSSVPGAGGIVYNCNLKQPREILIKNDLYYNDENLPDFKENKYITYQFYQRTERIGKDIFNSFFIKDGNWKYIGAAEYEPDSVPQTKEEAQMCHVKYLELPSLMVDWRQVKKDSVRKFNTKEELVKYVKVRNDSTMQFLIYFKGYLQCSFNAKIENGKAIMDGWEQKPAPNTLEKYRYCIHSTNNLYFLLGNISFANGYCSFLDLWNEGKGNNFLDGILLQSANSFLNYVYSTNEDPD